MRPRTLLIGGSACVGKTTAVAAITRRTGIRHLQVDELLRSLDEPRLPAIGRGADFWDAPVERLRDILIRKGQVLAPHIRQWTREHGRELVLEGEGIVPTTPGAVVVCIVELDAGNQYEAMERTSSSFRALSAVRRDTVVAMCVSYSAWLADQARLHRMPLVPARPWSSLPDRILGEVAR